MSFNLFASPTKDDISVGYIDPTLGYVNGVSICEANNYAKDNPGTTFIFVDGDNNIQYLNINEVNRLTTNNLVSTASTCAGIQAYKECGPPRIQFFGGGGIGAVGNPIVGKDGSLLAVDLVYGGNGYQYPPIVAAKDDCQFGNGAVLTAILGETVDEIEVYEGEDDFEEYELCEDTDVGYGFVYGRDGEEIGPWEPKTYTKIGEDPIKREIEIYQKALENPFWTTRKFQPDRISSLGQEYSVPYNATHPEWGEFMNQYAISPVKPSDLVGSDEAGKIFRLEWEQNFPISGEYIFRGVCDNSAQVYIDNSLVGDLLSFKQNPSPIQKTIREGNHIIRIDLYNTSIEENVSKTITTSSVANLNAKFVQKGSDYFLEVSGTGTGEISFVMDVNDASYIAGLAAKEVRIPSDSGKIAFKRTPYKYSNITNQIPQFLVEETIKKSGTFSGGKTYGPIEIIGAAVGARGPIPIKKSSNKFALRDADGDDENIKITIAKVSSKSSTSTTTIEKIISPKSWNQNPIGVSMLIEAPTPNIPQEQPPIQTGRCPPNPIWSTRFPGSVQKWYPVRFTKNNAWSTFMNRYAISPVPPLDTPGSDTSGSIFSNSWDIDLPYAGYYGVKGTRDNRGRILIDGKEVSNLDGFNTNNPKLTKIYLTKGKHTITVEVYNTPIETTSSVDTKIFSTQDWRVPAPLSSGSFSAKFIQEGTNFYLQVDGTGTGEISFVMDVNDASYIAGLAAKEVIIPSDSGKIKFTRKGFTGIFAGNPYVIPKEETIKQSGTFSGGKKYGPIQIIGADPGARGPIPIKNGSNKFALRDADGDDENIKITITKVISKSSVAITKTSQSPTKNGVNYDGPELFGYTDSRWSKFMNDFSVSPKVFTYIDSPDERVVGKYILTWKDINFPQDGVYKFNFQSDNIATLKVGGKEIYKTSDFNGEKIQYTFNASAGKYDVVIELENVRSPTNKGNDTTFSINPMGAALYISKDVTFTDSNKTPWTDNPMAISAILIPPPCAKKIGGKGVINKVIVEDPGNGYLPVENPGTPGTGYPVTLVLDQVIVENSGINYRCGEDLIQISPNNGAVLDYTCDSFGRINEVKVLNSGVGFNVYPQITMPSETGVNASFRPVFRIIRDPLLPPEKLIQVTDLVGLKQTGYVDGRAYYGAVYYDEGIRYAGYYKTIGTQIRVYDTLQESITAKVTTTPSAIQKSGTDIRSNDPTLNIPGTPQSTTEQS